MALWFQKILKCEMFIDDGHKVMAIAYVTLCVR
jgi:hypothetical protein